MNASPWESLFCVSGGCLSLRHHKELFLCKVFVLERRNNMKLLLSKRRVIHPQVRRKTPSCFLRKAGNNRMEASLWNTLHLLERLILGMGSQTKFTPWRVYTYSGYIVLFIFYMHTCISTHFFNTWTIHDGMLINSKGTYGFYWPVFNNN